MNIGKILIIDDEIENTDVIKDSLEDVNYSVVCANNAQMAKKIIFKDQFDLIMIDVWMPEQDGMALLKELLNNGIITPIIMMSGHAEHNDVVKAIKLGAVDFIKKPINDILSLVRNTLNNNNKHNIYNLPLKQARSNFEKSYFNYHLKTNQYNISKVAKISKIERTTLYRKLKDLGIEKQ